LCRMPAISLTGLGGHLMKWGRGNNFPNDRFLFPGVMFSLMVPSCLDPLRKIPFSPSRSPSETPGRDTIRYEKSTLFRKKRYNKEIFLPDTGSDGFFPRRRTKKVLLSAIGGPISCRIVVEWAGSKGTPLLRPGLRRSAPILRRRIAAFRGVPRRSRSSGPPV